MLMQKFAQTGRKKRIFDCGFFEKKIFLPHGTYAVKGENIRKIISKIKKLPL
jgi:hypothetical protein